MQLVMGGAIIIIIIIKQFLIFSIDFFIILSKMLNH